MLILERLTLPYPSSTPQTQVSVLLVWNAILGACQYFGKTTLALELFEEMMQNKVKPTSITFIYCSMVTASLVDTAKEYIQKRLQLYNST
jgi:pentatricopeptide repeat protein